ncbi:MAG: bacillithiol biosynthesis cysteine-adding enzyme BshC, partial [Capnocytophaga sp.]|nr:bacillithiol biosynthesis cysteine-adding enzyme BshC [Capnocytophaga sp.]
MIIDYISFKETGYFSSFITDYLSEKKELKSLYNRFPSIENFKNQIEEKNNNYPEYNRKILVKSLYKQYENIELYEKVKKNIELLEKNNTFTITTGHQLSLFTGPLYFIYKIISVIKSCQILKAQYPENEFIPVYWMATEDHDFQEINHFYIHQKKVVWDNDQTGAVGDFQTETLSQVSEALRVELGIGEEAKKILALFKNTYLNYPNLTSATRYLVNELFKEYGLVIIDGNDTDLKRLFIPYFKKDLLENVAYNQVNTTISVIKGINHNYPAQVNPREINIFYLKNGIRERIVKSEKGFEIHNTDIHFTEKELLDSLEQNPENFSPNVILRPMYQEVILPNLCYVGGGGELAYWLELKDFFASQNITFPMLMLRNSVLIISEKQIKK